MKARLAATLPTLLLTLLAASGCAATDQVCYHLEHDPIIKFGVDFLKAALLCKAG